jgi:hypothetical protein
VLTLTGPQVWVLIGVFAAAMVGMIGIVTTSFNRTQAASIGEVRAEIGGLRETMDSRFEALDAKFTGKFDVLDRDILALSRRVFGTDPG